jgi:hypothetical protein
MLGDGQSFLFLLRSLLQIVISGNENRFRRHMSMCKGLKCFFFFLPDAGNYLHFPLSIYIAWMHDEDVSSSREGHGLIGDNLG